MRGRQKTVTETVPDLVKRLARYGYVLQPIVAMEQGE